MNGGVTYTTIPPYTQESGAASDQTTRHHHHIRIAALLAHLALGAASEIAVSQAAGGARKYPAALLAVGLVAAFKEGSDAEAGRDTKAQAAFHAASILAGAGLAVAVKP